MNGLNKFEIGTPVKFGLDQIIILNLLTLIPSAMTGGLGGLGLAGIVIGVLLNFPRWILFFSLSCLFFSLTMLYFCPFLMHGNYYIRSIASDLLPVDCGSYYICQMAAHPRIYDGLRGFFEDADDVGLLCIHHDRIEFRGDHINFTIVPDSNITVELRNIGHRGFWFAGRRIRIILDGQDQVREIDIVERQSYTVPQARKIPMQLFREIQKTIKKK